VNRSISLVYTQFRTETASHFSWDCFNGFERQWLTTSFVQRRQATKSCELFERRKPANWLGLAFRTPKAIAVRRFIAYIAANPHPT